MKAARTEPTTAPKIFPGLNGLRFLAALAVIVHHIEQIKFVQGFPSLWNLFIVMGAGEVGVSFFFVLSGFLITYLLSEELRTSGKISIKDFYARRALRIWPVYYLLTFLGFFVFPFISFLKVNTIPDVWDGETWKRFAYYLFLTAHYPERFMGTVVFASPLWSTAVEEHFYLLWPHLVRWAKNRLLGVLLGVIAVGFVLRNLGWIYGSWVGAPVEQWGPGMQYHVPRIETFFAAFRIGCMGIGGLGAWLYMRQSRLLKILYSVPVQIGTVLWILNWMFRGVFGQQMRPYDTEIYAVLFMIVILNVATNPRTLVRLNGPLCEFMGKISYGLYAYNWIAITIVLNTLIAIQWAPASVIDQFFLVYVLCIGMVVAMATLSYYGLEKPFLKLKDRFRPDRASA